MLSVWGSRKVSSEWRGSTVAQQMHNNVKVNKMLIMLGKKNVALKRPSDPLLVCMYTSVNSDQTKCKSTQG